MEFEKLITERYSVRNFKRDALSLEVVERIISAGHRAPTGCNYQPQRILVLNTEESMEKLRQCTKCHFGAPAAMLVCADTDESWRRPYDGELSAPVDAVIVATHMMLKAYEEGVGCCWVMHFDPFKMREAFNIPENVKPVALLVMGYPSDEAKPHDFHYKFRPIDEVVFYDTF